MDIKCPAADIAPDAAVVVATVRALKMHGGVSKAKLDENDIPALLRGFENLKVHVENVRKFGVPVIVAINRFASDTQEELDALCGACRNLAGNGEHKVEAVVCESWEKGGRGSEKLAEAVVALCKTEKSRFKPLYKPEDSFIEKLENLAFNIYRADKLDLAPLALKKICEYTDMDFGDLPVCVAKTQNSISHDKNLIGAPAHYAFPIRDVQLKSGAGFLVAYAGDIMSMPGLPKIPAACSIDVDNGGHISGLF